MRTRAGPGVIRRLARHRRADRVAFDVGERRDEMMIVQGAREKSVLPEMPAASVETVDVLRVDQVRAADGAGERILVGGRGDQVDVVRHEAIAGDDEAELFRLLFQDGEVTAAIVVDEKSILAVVPTLRDVMRNPRDDDSGDARHERRVLRREKIIKKTSKRP